MIPAARSGGRRLGVLLAGALVAAIAAGQAMAQVPPFAPPAQAPAPLTGLERARILASLAEAGRPVAADSDDEAILATLAAYGSARINPVIERPAALNANWGLTPVRRDVTAELAAARANGQLIAWLEALRPANGAIAALEAAQRIYSALTWSPLPARLRLKTGDKGPTVEALRTRLAAEGYDAPAPVDEQGLAHPELFDPGLADALTNFQTSHGLEPDGRVGAQTLVELNVLPSARAAQIEANLERLKWEPANPPAYRIEVDITTAEAVLYEAGSPLRAMRAVVGDTKHETPLLTSALEAVIFNPPWKAPDSIAKAELWPKERASPGYFTRNQIQVIDGRLEQRPGPQNALGQVKFDFRNPYGVYLHDTPAKGAFARWRRALSHGCVRLEKPRDLAALALSGQGWDAAAVEAAIAAGETRRVALDRPVPLFIYYRTVVPDGFGGVRFRPDVYGWDAELISALSGRTP